MAQIPTPQTRPEMLITYLMREEWPPFVAWVRSVPRAITPRSILKLTRNVGEAIAGFALCWVVCAAGGIIFGLIYQMLGHALLGDG